MISLTHFHPMVVHFPIALILIGFLADLISLFFKQEKCLTKTGFYLMIVGTLSAIVAYISGNFFTEHPEEGAIHEVFELHESAALITLIIMLVASIIRIFLVVRKLDETNWKWLVFALYLAGTIAVSITGFWGGSMVFDYMTGI
ncbi:DUF2231 domain-containing protein [Bacteroidetes/Chlorobi group bacterium ChocPot_Mid]|nr:MAG: DUF2231 domain-containing protein [Bacteroidetes/Chlorobi group bacterium ChocPot_Mid]